MSGAGEPDFLSTIVGMFLESTPARLDALNQGAADGDLRVLQRISHDLKSSSAALGASILASLCAELESLVRSGTKLGTVALVGDIAREFEAVRPDLKSLRKASNTASHSPRASEGC